MKEKIRNKIKQKLIDSRLKINKYFLSKEEKDYLDLFLKEKNVDITNFSEKLYFFYYDLREKKVCKFGQNKKFLDFYRGYGFCSSNCECMKEKVAEKIKNKSEEWKKNRYQKAREQIMKKYGVDSFLKHSAFKEKFFEFKKIAVEKRMQSYKEKYGISAPFQDEKIREKALKNSRKTIFEKYGVTHNSQIHLDKKILEKINDKDWLYENYIVQKKTIREIAKEIGVSETTIKRKLLENNIQIITKKRSFEEKNLENFIKNHPFVDKESIQISCRNIIYPYELDIFFMNKNGKPFAIEYCGLFWHSLGKRKKGYHLEKLERCEEKGITLFTIFSNSWIKDSDKIKNIISLFLEEKEDKIWDKDNKKSFLFDRRYGNGKFLEKFGFVKKEEISPKIYLINDDYSDILCEFKGEDLEKDLEKIKNKLIEDCGWILYVKE